MAKKNIGETYTKATIDVKAGTISEVLKEGVNVYSIETLLNNWDGIEGITLTIKKDDSIKPIQE